MRRQDDPFRWMIHLGYEVWAGTPLQEDLLVYSDNTGQPVEVVLEATFPEEFPIAPPMLRIVRPRFRPLTGGVYAGGAIHAPSTDLDT